MIHIALHFLIPITVGFLFFRKRMIFSTAIMISTMLVDVDHLLADPIYDPLRCSINFHPLHSQVAIGAYLLLFLVPIFLKRVSFNEATKKRLDMIQLIGLGLIIHMALDAIDCL